jgi:hypothetical protein
MRQQSLVLQASVDVGGYQYINPLFDGRHFVFSLSMAVEIEQGIVTFVI